MDIFTTYLQSSIKQAKCLTKELKAQDPIYHQTTQAISVYGEMPTNLEHSHNLLDLFSNKFGVEIVLQSSKSDFVGAYILRFADRIEILVRGGNTCWTRFFCLQRIVA